MNPRKNIYKKDINNFEKQWSHPEIMDFSGSKVEVYDIKPEHQKTKIATAMVPGWGGTPEAYRENIRTLVGKGRRTISVNAPHGINFDRGELTLDELDNTPDAELRKVAALINSLNNKNISKVDAVGHSQGCLDIVVAATLYPEMFHNLVLVNPAGMIGKDSFWRLATGFSIDVIKGYVEEIRKNKLSEPMLRAISEINGSIIKDPVLAFREVLAISDAQIHELLISLRKKGIGISIISAVDDKVFPADRMQNIINKKMVDGFYTVEGSHNDFQLNAKVYTELVDCALEMMSKKDDNKDSN